MEIYFLGVGEACDGRQPNTSILLKTAAEEATGRILLDCGFSVPHRYFSLEPDPDELEMLWISHFHGDHFFGTPLLLLWFWENGRQKPLHILGPPDIAVTIEQAMQLAYPNFLDRLNFPLLFHEPAPGCNHTIGDTLWQTAYDEHSQPCLSLRLEYGDKSLFYSGDGRPTGKTAILAQGCDVIIHEAYGFEDSTPGHGSIGACIDFARRAGAGKLALVHMQRDIRLRAPTVLEGLRQNYPDLQILLPETGNRISF